MKTNQPQGKIVPEHERAHVSGANRRTLEALFRHPSAHNLEWNDVVALIDKIGDVNRRTNNEFEFSVGGEVHFVRKPHTKDIEGTEVIKLRKFLAHVGWTSEQCPVPASTPDDSTLNLMVVIDHHDAKIYDIATDPENATEKTIRPYDPHHFLHHLTHRDQSAARGQRAPEDITFYQAIASALTRASSIIIVGHGAGKSNAANHLSDYLRKHHAAIAERIVRESVADLSSVTEPQLLALARME
jgi:hypothetical protein